MNQLFLERMKNYLSESDFNKYLECLNEKPTRSIRLNNIDYDTFTSDTNMPLEKISYDPDGYYLLNDEKYGNSIYHHLGAFYLQEPSAMLPVNIYKFRGDEIVLDLCASPGGKSSQILKRIPFGVLVSNEIDKKRSDVLFSNLERLGYSNAIVTNNSAEELARVFNGFFDVILVDAPCSGEGMMRKEIEARENWSLDNILLCAKRDKEIINCASKMLKSGGKIIYSTCTFAREEDCDMVDYICSLGYHTLKAPKEIEEATVKGFIENTYRFYPMNRGEGQFVSLLEKDRAEDTKKIKPIKEVNDKELGIVKKFLKDNLTINFDNVVKYGSRYYLYALDIDITKLNIKNYGVELGIVEKNRFIPYHHLFKSLGKYFKNKVELEYNDPRIAKYLRGEEISVEGVSLGYGVLMTRGLVLGGFKASGNKLKNHYPKGLRNN